MPTIGSFSLKKLIALIKKHAPAAAGAADAGWTDDGTDVRLTTATDKVGIGTASPATKVEIEVADSENLGGLLIDLNETGAHTAFEIDSESTSNYSAKIKGKYGALIEQDISSGYALLATRNIAEAGSSPLAYFKDDHTSNTQTTMKIRQDGTGDILNLFDGATEVLTVTDGGKVGIGVAAPSAVLEVRQDESTTLTDFTQAVSKAGILINMDYTADAYTPGLYWNTEDNNSTKPKAGIYLRETSTGTYLYLGTSNHYATGITTNTIIDPDGKLTVAGDLQVVGNDIKDSGDNAILRFNGSGRAGFGGANVLYGAFQLNQAADNDEAGIAVLNSSGQRSIRIYCDASNNSVINSGDGGAQTLKLNEGSGQVTTGGDLQVAGALTAKTKHVFNLAGSVSAAPGGGYYLPWVTYTESQSISANTISAMRNSLIAPYDGKFLTVMVSSEGTGTEPGSTDVGVHKNHSGTALETQTINMVAFSTTYTATFSSNSFSKGDMLHVNLDATNSLDYVLATVVLEFDEST